MHVRLSTFTVPLAAAAGIGALAWGGLQGDSKVVRLARVPELAARADFHEVGIPAGELFRRLKRRHGVPLSAGEHVQDQKIILFARQESTGIILDQIADLLGAVWLSAPGGGFRLVRGRKAHEYAERYNRERDRQAAILQSARLKRYRAMIGTALRNLELPAIETSEGDRVRRYVGGEGEQLGPLLRRLSTDEVTRLFQAGAGGVVLRTRRWVLSRLSKEPAFSLPVTQLPAEERTRVEEALQTRARTGSLGARYTALLNGRDLLVHFGNYHGDSVDLSLTSAGAPGWAPDFQLAFGADWSKDEALNAELTGEERAAFVSYQRDLRTRLVAGSPLLAGQVTGLSEREAATALHLELEASRRGDRERRVVSLPAVLLALHLETKRTVISDYFTKPQRIELPPPSIALGRLLNEMSEVFGRDLMVSGRAIRSRSVSWPDDERAEVPARRLRPWLAHKSKLGYLPAEDWLDMGRLSAPQVMSLCEPSDLFGDLLTEEAGNALSGYDVLQYYHQLTPRQKAKAGTRDGLRFSDLFPVQQRRALQLGRFHRGAGISPEGLLESFKLTMHTSGPHDIWPPGYLRSICWVTIMLPGGFGIWALLPFDADATGRRPADEASPSRRGTGGRPG